MKFRLFLAMLLCLCQTLLWAQNDTLYVYGPGAPYPPIQEAAKRFSQQHQVPVKVIKGPFGKWKNAATSFIAARNL
ncbi:hypothetical protein [Riemerella columbina]|uniref:hypothetical protein n=1 Tax=Riemerella columbina TaxID=103810 RepID=UPI00266F9951|nr:hypothetical protein [Riemerella columbina]WKS95392.1 hypothetical protein NYR17_01230 [Riemerella columbina]